MHGCFFVLDAIFGFNDLILKGGWDSNDESIHCLGCLAHLQIIGAEGNLDWVFESRFVDMVFVIL